MSEAMPQLQNHLFQVDVSKNHIMTEVYKSLIQVTFS